MTASLDRADPASATLLVLSGPGGATGSKSAGGLRSGRAAGAAGRLGDDPALSRWHARIDLAGEELVVEDLASTNGTLLNGQRVSGRQPVRPGDVVTLGASRLQALPPTGSAPANCARSPPLSCLPGPPRPRCHRLAPDLRSRPRRIRSRPRRVRCRGSRWRPARSRPRRIRSRPRRVRCRGSRWRPARSPPVPGRSPREAGNCGPAPRASCWRLPDWARCGAVMPGDGRGPVSAPMGSCGTGCISCCCRWSSAPSRCGSSIRSTSAGPGASSTERSSWPGPGSLPPAYLIPLNWTGFHGQTLWDWLHLLLLPAALASTRALTRRNGRPTSVLRSLRPHQKGIIAALTAGWVVTVIGGYALRWAWTGYSGNTLWDWLQLLLVPLVFPTLLYPTLLRWITGNAAKRASEAAAARKAAAVGGHLRRTRWPGHTRPACGPLTNPADPAHEAKRSGFMGA